MYTQTYRSPEPLLGGVADHVREDDCFGSEGHQTPLGPTRGVYCSLEWVLVSTAVY